MSCPVGPGDQVCLSVHLRLKEHSVVRCHVPWLCGWYLCDDLRAVGLNGIAEQAILQEHHYR